MIHKLENALNAISLGFLVKRDTAYRIPIAQNVNITCMANATMLLKIARNSNTLVDCVLPAMMDMPSIQISLEHKHAKRYSLNVNKTNI